MTKELKGRDVLKIRKTSFVRDYKEETKMKGQKYQIFSFEDKAFIVNLNDDFINHYNNGNVYSVQLGVGDEGLSLFNFTTIDQEVRMAKTERVLADIMSVDVKLEAVTNPEELV
jgi:hypothetical protein